MATTPARHGRVMRLLRTGSDYPEVSVPAGSIGPTRGRCLERLARHAELRAPQG